MVHQPPSPAQRGTSTRAASTRQMPRVHAQREPAPSHPSENPARSGAPWAAGGSAHVYPLSRRQSTVRGCLWRISPPAAATRRLGRWRLWADEPSPAGFLAGRIPSAPTSSSRGFVRPAQAASEQPPGDTGYLDLRPSAGWPAEQPDGTSRPGEQPKIAPREDGASAGTEMGRRIGSTGLAPPAAAVPTRPATAGPGCASRASADFETVKWIYLRKTGETAAYQLHRGLRAGRGAHMGRGRGRSSAGAPPPAVERALRPKARQKPRARILIRSLIRSLI